MMGFGRVAGRDLPLADEVFESFPVSASYLGDGLPKSTPAAGPLVTTTGLDKLVKRMFEEQLGSVPSLQDVGKNGSAERFLQLLKRWREGARARGIELEAVIKAEFQRNKDEGSPMAFNPWDAFDPYGREFTSRAGSAEPWNKPVIPRSLVLKNEQGAWLSGNTLLLLRIHKAVADVERELGWITVPEKKRPPIGSISSATGGGEKAQNQIQMQMGENFMEEISERFPELMNVARFIAVGAEDDDSSKLNLRS
ncbi:hypothetical protein BU16DRAFT_583293 [Lophium mytilinum]|uniref:Uncharacterized protein n=1 Tax=Lophium mytilinum TaxID=390894 RepID=A0A6A6QN16_9PEZI|nr:hypothetical protein BU16DRAFT_583293 [Lophium mytilinum]